MAEVEALGAAVTAGLVGAAVEPQHGARQGTAADGAIHRCLNCGTVLAASHCAGCGQPAHIHRSLSAIGHDLVHAIFHFDGKFWRTLPLLVWKPGELTRRYIHGERASFISPLALFLFAVFLTYAVLASIGIGGSGTPGVMEAIDQQTRTAAARTEIDKRTATIDAAIAAARQAGQPVAALEAERAALDRVAAMISGTAAARVELVDLDTSDSAETAKADATPAEAAPVVAQPQLRFALTDLKTGVPVIDDAIGRANDNPSLILYKIQANAYKFAWALIPISVPFLWLLYPFSRRFNMYDHFVFVTYSISFMLLLFVFIRLVETQIADTMLTVGLLFFYPPFHMYRQLRGAYRSSRAGALVRTVLLMLFSLIVLLTFFLLLLGMGVMG